MQAWFADSYYFLALRNPKDEGHAKAVAATGKPKSDGWPTSNSARLDDDEAARQVGHYLCIVQELLNQR